VTSPPLPALDVVLRDVAARLARAGVASARADAELLAAHVLGRTRGETVAAALRGERLDADAAGSLESLVKRREGREPLQHLTGSATLRHIEVAVGPGVFVPRPETEILAGLAVDEANAVLARRPGGAVLVVDLCTGSGAVALAVADEVPAARVVAVEVDPAAHAWAQRNVRELPAGARVDLRLGDAVGADQGVAADLVGQVDVVVANPPYIPDGARPLDPEVAEHDPHLALFGGGADGLDVPRGVVAAALRLLRPAGLFLMEHADVQGASTRALVEGAPAAGAAAGAAAVPDGGAAWTDVRTVCDLSGRDRVLVARRPATEPPNG
jgi:release factor glutamine methyltransferase